MAFALFLCASEIPRWGLRRSYCAGLVLSALGLALSGLAIDKASLPLLWVSYALIFGVGVGLLYLPIVILSMTWFRLWGKPGLSQGIIGLFCGIWPAGFSYLGPAIMRTAGVSGSFYYAAVGVAVLSAPAVPFIALPSEMREGLHISAEVGKAGMAPATGVSVNDGPSNAVAMLRTQILGTPQFWQLFVGFTLLMTPGFGVKLIISPMMQAVFAANDTVQSAASFIFLAAYAIGRGGVGLTADRVTLRTMYSCFGLLQFVALTAAGLSAYFPSLWAFVAVNTLLALALAGSKVMCSIAALYVFGAPNVGLAFGMLLLTVGIAATMGPVSMWAVVVQGNMTDGEFNDGTNDNVALQRDTGYWCWGASAVTVFATVMVLRGLRPLTFGKKTDGGGGGESDGEKGTVQETTALLIARTSSIAP